MIAGDAPPLSAFTRAERRLIERLRTPAAVQAWLNALPYNNETRGETLRSFRGVITRGTAHCLEAALSAAVILEQHRYPPLVLSFESIDLLDHVIFVYRRKGRWGSIARSRDPGLLEKDAECLFRETTLREQQRKLGLYFRCMEVELAKFIG